MEILKSYKKALVIGAGSGADIISALLLVGRLRIENPNIIIDLAGFLTPWALHTFNDNLEKPINELKHAKAKKFIIGEEENSLPFFEIFLSKMNKKQALGVKNIYLFSLQYGIPKPQAEIQKLVDREKYDLILAVDVGGDILARKKDFSQLITPIVDFSCLELIHRVRTKAIKYLAVIAPGADGELSASSLKEIINIHSKNGVLLKQEVLSKSSVNNIFLKALRLMKKYSVNLGYTTKIISQIINGTVCYKQIYRKKLVVRDKKWPISYPVVFNPKIVSSIYYLNLEKLYKVSNIKIAYDSVFQAFKLFKKIGAGGTEVDLKYVAKKFDNQQYAKGMFICNFFNRVPQKQRKAIIEYLRKSFGSKEMIIR